MTDTSIEELPEHRDGPYEGWPVLPDPPPADPYDEDGYCWFCGYGSWKNHGVFCEWADKRDGVTAEGAPA